MNILFCSVVFTPLIGGVVTVSQLLAERFHAAGHRVVLLTQTPADGVDSEPYRVVRRPGPWTLLKLIKWADVVFHNNISLRLAWPLLLLDRKWVVAHHMWTPRDGAGGFAGRLKHVCCRYARNIVVSDAMAESLDVQATVIPNPYAEDAFVRLAEVPRDLDLVFLGRLVSDKGVPVLLDALAVLATRGERPSLTIIGDGPDEPTLRQQAERLGLTDQVRFAGSRRGPELVAMLNAHRIMVVPSTWDEPFGVVALEGLACGCVPIVSRSGGLPDAVGPCGVVVPKGDPAALAGAIGVLLSDAAARQALLARAPEHLANHARDRVAQRYLAVIEDAYRSA